jgi:hypothetical protein
MPVTFELEENRRVMLWRLIDPWTLPELMAYYKEAQNILDGADQAVHSLIDLQQARRMPSGVLKARYTSTWDHPRSGYTVIAGGTPLMSRMLELVFKMTRFERIRFFEDEAAARAFLNELISTNSPDQSAPSV